MDFLVHVMKLKVHNYSSDLFFTFFNSYNNMELTKISQTLHVFMTSLLEWPQAILGWHPNKCLIFFIRLITTCIFIKKKNWIMAYVMFFFRIGLQHADFVNLPRQIVRFSFVNNDIGFILFHHTVIFNFLRKKFMAIRLYGHFALWLSHYNV
jgi:hypothetical protein